MLQQLNFGLKNHILLVNYTSDLGGEQSPT